MESHKKVSTDVGQEKLDSVSLNSSSSSSHSSSNASSSSMPYDPTKTAKPVLAIKHATSQPSFWLSRGKGTRQTPLSRGEHALIFLTKDDIINVDKRPDVDKIQSVGIRARWINKVYQHHIKTKNCKQIIILGSGFDVRPFKKNQTNQTGKKHASVYAQVKFYEIDSEKILDIKEKIFSENHEDKNSTYIRGDYTAKEFIEQLAKAGVDFKAPTLFIWEGNIYYLEKSQVSTLIDQLKKAFHDFAITFDYFKQSFLEETRIKYPNLPWKTGSEDIQEFAKTFGLTIIDHQEINALAKEYQVDEKPVYGAAHYVCTLRK